MILEITLSAKASMSPNKLLGRSFWVYKQHKKDCLDMLRIWETGCSDEALDADVWKKMIEKRRDRVHVTINGYGCRPKDCDNLVAGCKALIDVLRQEGYMINDDPTNMSLSVNSFKVSHKKDEKLTIILEDV